MNVIAENITRRRKELNMTQRELAEKLDISDKTVSRWEIGNQIPDALMMPKLAEILKISINELYGVDVKNEMNNEQEKTQNFAKEKNEFKIKVVLGTACCAAGIKVLWGQDAGTGEVLLIGMLIIGIALIAIAKMTFTASYCQIKDKQLYEEYDQMAIKDIALAICVVLISLILWR